MYCVWTQNVGKQSPKSYSSPPIAESYKACFQNWLLIFVVFAFACPAGGLAFNASRSMTSQCDLQFLPCVNRGQGAPRATRSGIFPN